MIKNKTKKDPLAVALGKRGGQKTLEKKGIKHYRTMAKRSAEARKKLSTGRGIDEQAVVD